MAAEKLETEENGSEYVVGPDAPSESVSDRSTPKRFSPTSPGTSPPRKSPRMDSASGRAETKDSAAEGHPETDLTEDPGGLEPAANRPASPDTRRRSWRRSTRGRRSLPALLNPYQNLCRSISTSLSQQERLEKLMEASMKLAIERTQNSLQSVPNNSLEVFQKQVGHIQKKWDCVARDIRRDAQSQALLTTAASEPAMQKTMETIQKAIQRLQVEADSWEAMLSKHKTKAAELRRTIEQSRDRGVTLDSSSVRQSSQYQVIQSKPDYHSLLQRQQPVLHTMAVIMDTQCKVVRELVAVRDHSQLVIRETSGRLAAESGLPDPTPDLLKNLVAVPVPSTTT